jgi:hypothetical protein
MAHNHGQKRLIARRENTARWLAPSLQSDVVLEETEVSTVTLHREWGWASGGAAARTIETLVSSASVSSD